MKKVWIIVIIGFLAACSAPPETPAEAEPTIVGGQDAKPHEFPFMLRSESDLGNGRAALCGGALLSKDWAITAAHCVNNSQGVTIIAGKHSATKKEDSEQRINVEEIIIADGYQGEVGQGYDIALLKLSQPLKLNDKVQPIAYASKMPADGSTLTAIGWGMTSYPDGNGADSLQKVNLKLDIAGGCQDRETIMCTAQGEKSAAPGDSGGPIFEDGKLLGLTSYGNVSSDNDIRTFYAKVPAFADWIEAEAGISPDGEGAEPQPEPEPEPEPEPGEDVFTGNLADGKTTHEPDGSYFKSKAGTQSATLSGPDNANFDLYLYKWSGSSWEIVARGTNENSSEALNYEGEAGYYAWLVYARDGAGDYTLDIERP